MNYIEKKKKMVIEYIKAYVYAIFISDLKENKQIEIRLTNTTEKYMKFAL